MATALIYSKLVGTQKFLRPRPDGPTRRMGFTVQWSDAAPGADAGNDTLPIPQGGVSPPVRLNIVNIFKIVLVRLK